MSQGKENSSVIKLLILTLGRKIQIQGSLVKAIQTCNLEKKE